ncbi:uncharacterized protein [Choristoneura fumiferana]|uniref:uncharacterized protein n=1 Tax=Choristoneura fumiferana TaxID=7141 RepID=UPI003D154B27
MAQSGAAVVKTTQGQPPQRQPPQDQSQQEQPQIDPQAPAAQPAVEVMALTVSSRIPDFWTDQPRIWFIRAEAVLTPQRAGDDAKFDMVVSKLPKEIILRLTDLLTNPPANNKYETLKNKLLNMLEDSKNRQIEKLLGEMDLGDQKPSQLLQQMRNLAKDNFPEDTLRILWQNRLPTTVRAVLIASREASLETLANIADDVAEATRTRHVSEVATYGTTLQKKDASEPRTHDASALILAEIAKLNVRMNDMERERGRSYQRRYDKARGSRSASRMRNDILIASDTEAQHKEHLSVIGIMGWGQSKDEEKESHNTVAIAQVKNFSGQVESKLNYVGIALIVICAVLTVLLLYIIRRKCKDYTQSWVRRAMEKASPPLAAVRVIPESLQQQAVPVNAQQVVY